MEPKESDMERSINGDYEEYPLPEVTVVGKKCCRIPIRIEPIVFSLFLAESISDSIIQNFILMRTCVNHFHFNQSICEQLMHPQANLSHLEEIVQPYSAEILTGMNFLSKLFPAFLSFFLGPWSDYNGRKLMLILPALGCTVQYVMMIVLSFYPKLGPEYGLLVVVPVALTGGITNFITGVYSYCSDISQEENRTFRISLIESVIYCSVYIGLVSASYVLKVGVGNGYVFAYGFCAFIVTITAIPTYFFVPESVQSTERGRGILKIFDFGLLKEMFQVCFKKKEKNKRAIMFLVIAILTITVGVATAESNVLYLYTKLQFGWDIHEFTIWASVILASSFIGLLLGSAMLTKLFKISDATTGVISYLFKTISAIYIAFIPSNAPHLLFYNGFLVFFNGLCGPVGRAILSKCVPSEDLGKVFALLGTTEAIFPLVLGPLFTVLYNSTIRTTPNAFLFVSSSTFLLCTVFYVIIYFLQKQNREIQHEPLNNETESE